MTASNAAPFSKISVSGPTLASLLERFASSPTNIDGYLFGHVTHLPAPSLSDDSPSSESPPPPPPPLPSITITSFLSSFSPLSPFSPSNPSSQLIGFFSGRRHSSLRPSMRELALSSVLSKTLTLDPPSCVLLLLTSFVNNTLSVHTHDFQAYVLAGRSRLRPVAVEILSVGSGAKYDSTVLQLSEIPMVQMPTTGGGRVENGREEMEWAMEGLAGNKAVEYTQELEEMYRKMIEKLEGLARMVEESSTLVLDQESRNVLLRNKIFGSE